MREQLEVGALSAKSSPAIRLRGSAPAEGFSLVEVVIAMLLFALVAVGLLPLLVGVTNSTMLNRDIVRAKAVAQQQLADYEDGYPMDPSTQISTDRAVGQTLDCAALPVTQPVEQPIDEGLLMRVSAGPCPSSFPGTVAIEISVHDASNRHLSTVHSSLRVTQ